jgi:hypothetical protein
MKINKNNLVIITTTLPNNKISAKRKKTLINNFNKYNIPILFNPGKILKKPYKSIPIDRLKTFKETKCEYGIICDDDFVPINNFIEELNKTLELIPDNWECLHLCPGYLWGRKFRDNSKIGKLNPEYDMENIEYHTSGRFYINCNGVDYYERSFWLGGPEATLINKNSVDIFLNNYINVDALQSDIIFTKMLNNRSFVCREPQLGYENECGGSIFDTTSFDTNE